MEALTLAKQNDVKVKGQGHLEISKLMRFQISFVGGARKKLFHGCSRTSQDISKHNPLTLTM
jgi:hypothetical protein